MDRFDAMRVFTRIVERRSFTQAADDLGLPRSSVTDAVKGLEARLGVRLLRRTTRQVSPTLDGEAYYRRCVNLIADMEDAEGAFVGAKPSGLVRVDVHGTQARYFLLPGLPRIPAAISRYPAALQRSAPTAGHDPGGTRLHPSGRRAERQSADQAAPGAARQGDLRQPGLSQPFRHAANA